MPLLACSWSHITFSFYSIYIHIHISPSLQKIEESMPYAWTVEQSHAKLAELRGLKETTVSFLSLKKKKEVKSPSVSEKEF